MHICMSGLLLPRQLYYCGRPRQEPSSEFLPGQIVQGTLTRRLCTGLPLQASRPGTWCSSCPSIVILPRKIATPS